MTIFLNVLGYFEDTLYFLYIIVDDASTGEGGRSTSSRRSFSVSRSHQNLFASSSTYQPVGSMAKSVAGGSSTGNLNTFNPFSKSEMIQGEKSPSIIRKGPVVKTVRKSDNSADEKGVEPKPKKVEPKNPTRQVKSKPRNASPTKKVEKVEAVKAKAPTKAPVKTRDASIKRNEAKPKPREKLKSNGINKDVKSVPKATETDTSVKSIADSKSSDCKPKVSTNEVLKKKSVKPDDTKPKLEVEGKKMKTPKMPAPLSDKEKFELLFEAYCKWGTEETNSDLITAYQITRWLKNVELLDGKKVNCIFVHLV